MATAAVLIDRRELQDGLNHALISDGMSLDQDTLKRVLEDVVQNLHLGESKFNALVRRMIRRHAPHIRRKRLDAYHHAVGKALNTRRQRLQHEEEAWEIILADERAKRQELLAQKALEAGYSRP